MGLKKYNHNDSILIKRLKKVFSAYGVSSNLYSLNGYSEDRFCIEPENGRWIVYIGSRGNKNSLTTHKTCAEACSRLIERVSDSNVHEMLMMRKFCSEIPNIDAGIKDNHDIIGKVVVPKPSVWHPARGHARVARKKTTRSFKIIPRRKK